MATKRIHFQRGEEFDGGTVLLSFKNLNAGREGETSGFN